MIERIAHIRGKRRVVIEVPVLSPRLSSYWLHLVTPVRAGVARPLIEGLRNPRSPTTTGSADWFRNADVVRGRGTHRVRELGVESRFHSSVAGFRRRVVGNSETQ